MMSEIIHTVQVNKNIEFSQKKSFTLEKFHSEITVLKFVRQLCAKTPVEFEFFV